MTNAATSLAWDEIEPVVKPIITVWVDGSELRWAEHAWRALAAEGLTAYTSELERTACVLRVRALAAIYLDFCARAFDEGSPGDWREGGSDLIGAYPQIDLFTLGQLAEREGIDADNSPGYEPIIGDVIDELVSGQLANVTDTLARHWGGAALFASMWMSTQSDLKYPLTEDQVDEAVNWDTTAQKVSAWEWLAEQVPAGRM